MEEKKKCCGWFLRVFACAFSFLFLTLHTTKSNPQFREQVEWELTALEKANVIAFYFDAVRCVLWFVLGFSVGLFD